MGQILSEKLRTLKIRGKIRRHSPSPLPNHLGNDPSGLLPLGSPSRRNNEYAKPRWKENKLPNAKVHSAGLKTDPKTGAQAGAQFARRFYLMDSKKCFGIIRAALSLLKSVYYFPHNPKVAGSDPAPATTWLRR